MTRPSFLLVGAAKAGTTALSDALKQHPAVFLTRNKEPSYFAWQDRRLDVRGPGDWAALSPYVVNDWDAYQRLFMDIGRASASGEASTAYLYHPDAAERIYRRLPHVRIVAILRQPAERAYAAYLHLVRDGREKLPFAEALAAEPKRIAAGWEQLWHYRSMGRYADQLARYLKRFERERIFVTLHEDLREDPQHVLADVFSFLAVDPTLTPEVPGRANQGGLPRFRWLYRFLAAPRPLRVVSRRFVPGPLRHRFSARLRQWQVTKPPLDPVLRAELTAGFREEIVRLQDLIDRDLTAWLD